MEALAGQGGHGGSVCGVKGHIYKCMRRRSKAGRESNRVRIRREPITGIRDRWGGTCRGIGKEPSARVFSQMVGLESVV